MSKVGDNVFASFGHFGTVKVMRGTVVKVTPSGQVVVDFQETWAGDGKPRTRRFSPEGHEIGGEMYGSGHLTSEANYAILAEKQASQEATAALIAHLRSWSWRNKAELNALVAKMVELADRVPDDASTAQAIEARRAIDSEAGVVGDESAVPARDAP